MSKIHCKECNYTVGEIKSYSQYKDFICDNCGYITVIEEKSDFNKLVDDVHKNACEKGWWDGEERTLGEIIALMHSELSEAVEEYRNENNLKKQGINNEHYYNFGNGILSNEDSLLNKHKPEGIAVELADCVIRIMDYFGKKGWDLDAIIREKHEYNKSRPYKHGGKKI